ncbi:MAG: T9SS type A sorting domain-containing protein, partial [Chitinophagales bacterium]
GGTISKILLVIITLVMPFLGYNQSVFNTAFDVANAPNFSSDVLEIDNGYLFTQRADYNGYSHIQAMKLDALGNVLDSSTLAQSAVPLFNGFSGSLQHLSSNEFCQHYKVGPDSAIRLVFFDEDLNIIRDITYSLNDFAGRGMVKQTNDSTLLLLGQVVNPNYWDLVLINTDLQGNERWRTVFGESGKDDYGFAIELIGNKILISGNTQTLGPHLYELNPSGGVIWDTIYSHFDFGRNIKFHKDFGLFLLVDKDGVGQTLRYPMLLKLDSSYNVIWQKAYFSGELDTYLNHYTISDNGILTFAGASFIDMEYQGLFFQVDYQGDSLGSKILDYLPGAKGSFYDIRPTSDGGYIIGGVTDAPTQDSWIVKVNAWGCDNIPCIVSVNDKELPKGVLNCFPNPTHKSGTISGSLSVINPSTELRIYNALGQLVFAISITQHEFTQIVDFPAQGMYLVVVSNEKGIIQQQKWVVQ